MSGIEEAALWQAVQKSRTMLVRVARAEGLLAEDAVDCVQDALTTFVRLVRAGEAERASGAERVAPEVRPSAAEGGAEAREDYMPTLVTSVKNAARKRRKRHDRAKTHLRDDELEVVDASDPVDQLIARAEERIRLQGCVDGLCGIQKAVVTLRMLEEVPGEDVASALGISTSHVAVLLHRAKAALLTCMASPAKV